jgi:membrane-associated protein
VAGVGRMQYGRFQLFNVLGAVSWVLTFVIGGYLFGNIPVIRDNFGIVTLVIIVGSLLPMLWIALRGRG